MNIIQAPFNVPLNVKMVSDVSGEVASILAQLGIEAGEEIIKKHNAPLGDPIAIQIGEHVFTLRGEVCEKIEVELV